MLKACSKHTLFNHSSLSVDVDVFVYNVDGYARPYL